MSNNVGHDIENPVPAPEDDALRDLLSALTVPDPSSGFVDETLLRIGLHATRTAEATAGFVDRVMDRLRADPVAGGRMWASDSLSEMGSEVGARPFRERHATWPKVVAGLLAAAALAFALIPRADGDDTALGVGLGRIVARTLPVLDAGGGASGLPERFSFPAAPVLLEPGSDETWTIR